MSGGPTWAKRLPGGLAPEAWAFLHSLPHDRFLWPYDIRGTIAHVHGLEEAGVLKGSEARKLRRELDAMAAQPELISDDDEDVHSAIERVLTERLGPLGAKVHAGRSRNDQVATALRLWARDEITAVRSALAAVVGALTERAAQTVELLCPGYTHLQRAQPISVGQWLCAHAWAFVRDLDRLDAAYRTTDVSPLGAGALATSTLGISPGVAAEALGFDRMFDNAIDAVSDRDFLVDGAYACAMTLTHLSRLAEEIVLWSTAEFGFLRLPDAYATGSSMMPQKKNPDVGELARGHAGLAVGALTGLLVTLKALPLAYDRDLQTDKQHLRSVFPATRMALEATSGLVLQMGFDADRLERAAADDTLLATDLAEALVGRGVPFRRAHEQVAGLAHRATERGTSLAETFEADPDALAPLTAADVRSLLDPRRSLRRRTVRGGPSPKDVRRQIRSLNRIVERRLEGPQT